MPRDRPRYSFRPVTEADLPMMAAWLAEPHMAEWWDDPEVELAEIREHIDSISVEPLIIELDGQPIGYLQSYDPHLEDDHPYRDQPFGTLGIDISIASPSWSASAMARRSSGNSPTSSSPKARRASSSIRIRPTGGPSAPMKRPGSGDRRANVPIWPRAPDGARRRERGTA